MIVGIVGGVASVWSHYFQQHRTTVLVAAWTVFSIGVLVSFSYLVDRPDFWAWPSASNVPMALITAICFTLIANGMRVLANEVWPKPREPKNRP